MDTREMQQALMNLGWPIVADGDFGDRTHRAVQAFQKGFGYYDLLVDGMPGPQTHVALQLCLDRGGRVDDFFFWREFKSKGDGWINVHRDLIRGLHEYRLRYGPTTIVSGYRDVSYNAKVGGAPNSQHVYGNGADINPVASVNAVKNLQRFSGIGYQGSTGLVRHVDVRHVGPNTTGGTPQNPTIWRY
jgi:zinc D-Ala-D-Ala carboxypeptidase